MDEKAKERVFSLLRGIREEIMHSQNMNKSAEVRTLYLANACRYTELIEQELKGSEQR